jgi:methyl-accepting chemotaxis protein
MGMRKIFPQRRMSLHTKFVVILVSVSLVTGLLISGMLYFSLRNQLMQLIRDNLYDLVAATATQIDGDLHSQLKTPEDQNSEAYQQVYGSLMKVYRAEQDRVAYIYTMRQDADGKINFILDVEGDPDPIGVPYDDPAVYLAKNFPSIDKITVEDKFYSDQWGSFLSGYAPIYRSDGTIDGLLGIDIPASSVIAIQNQVLWISLITMIFVSGLMVFLGVIISNQIVNPILKVNEAIREIAETDLPELSNAVDHVARGDLTKTYQVKTKPMVCNSNDEVGELANSCNLMVDCMRKTGQSYQLMTAGLRSMLGEMKDRAAELKAASELMTLSAEVTGTGLSQINAIVQQMAEAANQEANSAQETTSAVDQLYNGIEGVARQSNSQAREVNQLAQISQDLQTSVHTIAMRSGEGAAEAENGAEKARASATTIQETIQGMKILQVQTNESARRVAEMGTHSEKISAIVETIEDIASQTNLLALNAAIEAARAGEHGKGFAVVADEVRRLAEKSAQATKEVAKLVKNIQVSVANAVTAMESSVGEIDSGVARANQSGQVLDEILQVIGRLKENSIETAEAAKKLNGLSDHMADVMARVGRAVDQNTESADQMAVNSQEVSHWIENIASYSEEESAAIEEVSSSTRDLNAQAQEMQNQAQAMHGLFVSLDEMVAHFKI